MFPCFPRSTLLAGLSTLLVLSTTSVGVMAAGDVQVSYADARPYADAGEGVVEVERTQRLLAAHLEALAPRLPTGQTLRVQVLDIDLAGEIQHFWPERLRVMGVSADSPRLHLRYELRRGGDLLAAGEDRLSDPGYLWRTLRWHEQGPLPHERRMIDDWFDARVATRAAALR